MTIIKDATIFWLKADPNNPVKIGDDNDGNPRMGWEVELRTEDKAEANRWRKEYNATKHVKAVREDKDDEESAVLFYRWKFRRNQFKANGQESNPPEVLRGDTGEAFSDPKIVGNGSVGDVRIFTREFTHDGVTKHVHYFLGLSVKELHRYVPQPKEEFEHVNSMKVVDPDGSDDGDVGSKALEKADAQPKKGRAAPKSKKTTPKDLDDEIPFDQG